MYVCVCARVCVCMFMCIYMCDEVDERSLFTIMHYVTHEQASLLCAGRSDKSARTSKACCYAVYVHTYAASR